MTPRRSFLKSGLLCAAAAFTPGASGTNEPKEPPGEDILPLQNIRKEAIQFFLHKGYRDIGELPLVTNEAFNGGLRYDDDMRGVAGATFRVQHCSRVEDLRGKGKRGVLPFFTMFAASAPAAAKPEFFSDVFAFLIDRQHLDPKKMTVTTTRLAKAHFPLFKQWGIPERQMRQREVEEAQSRGDGSGFFAPKGHPRCPGFPSFSIQYQFPDGGEIEIAEVIFPGQKSEDPQAGVGIGLERLAMAKGLEAPTWAEALQKMHAHIVREIKERGGDVPQGYKSLASG